MLSLPWAPVNRTWVVLIGDATWTPDTRLAWACEAIERFPPPCWSAARTTRSLLIDRSRPPVNESFNPAANTATNTASPIPIISADAVTAVREGLRRAFSPASRPVIPKSRNG